MVKKGYFCDCCDKEYKENELTWLTISLGSCGGWTDKEVCHDCWAMYVNKMADITKEMFNQEIKKGDGIVKPMIKRL
ncbi:hypothetical protein [Clostridium sp. ZBS18]|uniref:hypothetical protein n=1 Tax=Clostridium sp. ZBS18 TaxID=2949967 RepID=UPI002079645A|nr:hypothetical protein [Clostridium sp. ZBS18]